MGIQLLSVSHKAAPLEIRQLFAFSLSQQIRLMKALKEDGEIKEVVVLATCNRTEVYIYSEEEKERLIYDKMTDIVTKFALENQENAKDTIQYMSEYYRLYHGEKAIHHLFQVAAGLDSMVIGEDQILGQVKRAHNIAREHGMCGVYLNTFFRYCVTGSKRVKTETDLSKTSVSTATLAVKALQEQLGTLQGKHIMIIGSSGKIGNIVLKNLQSIGGMHLYITMRGINATKKEESEHTHGNGLTTSYEIIPYEERYHYMEKMDGIVSATASPHYTITKAHLKKYHTGKKKVLVDLAVPMDIEHKVQELEGITCYHMDDLQHAARENNERKKEEAKYAKEILKDYESQFKKWFLFQHSLQTVHSIIEHLTEEIEEKGSKKALSQFFYQVREEIEPEQLEVFLQAMKLYSKKEQRIEE